MVFDAVDDRCRVIAKALEQRFDVQGQAQTSHIMQMVDEKMADARSTNVTTVDSGLAINEANSSSVPLGGRYRPYVPHSCAVLCSGKHQFLNSPLPWSSWDPTLPHALPRRTRPRRCQRVTAPPPPTTHTTGPNRKKSYLTRWTIKELEQRFELRGEAQTSHMQMVDEKMADGLTTNVTAVDSRLATHAVETTEKLETNAVLVGSRLTTHRSRSRDPYCGGRQSLGRSRCENQRSNPTRQRHQSGFCVHYSQG